MTRVLLALATTIAACASAPPAAHPFALPRNGRAATATLDDRVVVVGAVYRPKTFAYFDGVTLEAAIKKADGLQPTADAAHVLIKREYATGNRSAVVSIDAIDRGTIPDVPLDPGDIVFVSERIF